MMSASVALYSNCVSQGLVTQVNEAGHDVCQEQCSFVLGTSMPSLQSVAVSPRQGKPHPALLHIVPVLFLPGELLFNPQKSTHTPF